jgi:AraC-like DNA-binding protein
MSANADQIEGSPDGGDKSGYDHSVSFLDAKTRCGSSSLTALAGPSAEVACSSTPLERISLAHCLIHPGEIERLEFNSHVLWLCAKPTTGSDFRADPDLQTLASEAGYSQSHFLRMFRAATGTTPHQYLLDLRLERVKEFLATQKTPLIEIAAACGFSSQSHLSTAFRRRFGATPSRYARELTRK